MSPSMGNGPPNLIDGTAGRDTISGLGGADTLNGNGGADYLVGGDGADSMSGAEGADTIADHGRYGANDTLLGGEGNDTLWGAGSDATVIGGGGDDVISISHAAGGVSRIEGGDGEDMLSLQLHDLASPVNLVIQDPALPTVLGGMTVTGIERFEIRGTRGTDTLVGGAGNDPFHDTPGRDIIRGGDGTDMVWFGSMSYRHQAMALSDGAFTIRPAVSGIGTGEPSMSGIEMVGFGHPGIDRTDQEIFWTWALLGQAAPAATGMPRAAGIEARVNTTTAGDQALTSYGPDITAVTALAGGGWVVTWGSTRAAGDPGDVHGRVFGTDGVARGEDFRLGTGAVGYQGGASVLALPDGGFMAIWLDVPDGSWEGSIRARRFAADGTPLTGDLVLRDRAVGYGAAAALMADGRILLAWTGTRHGTEGESLATVRTDIVDLDGTLSEAGTQIGIGSSRWVVDCPGQITLPALEQTEAPDLVRLADGGYVVSFSDNVLQRRDANGTPVPVPTVAGTVDPYDGTATVDIAPLAGSRYDSQSSDWVAGDSFIVVSTEGGRILGEIVGMSGGNTAMWSRHRHVDFEADADGSEVSVVGLPDGGFALAWAARRSAARAPLGSDIFLRVFDGRGTPQGNAVLVNGVTAGHQTNPHLALLGDGSLLVTWTGAEAGGTGTDVFSRRMLLSEIAISAAGFGGGLVEGMALLEGGTFLTSRGNVATSAAGVGQLIYEVDAKALWWNADGAGGEDSVLIATFKPKPNLVPADIAIVA